MLAIIVWVALCGLLVKAYNAFVYPVNYYGSWNKFWNAPFFSVTYVQNYWETTANVLIYLSFIFPPIIGVLLVWYGFHDERKYREAQNKQRVDDFMQNIQSSKEKALESKLKNRQ